MKHLEMFQYCQVRLLTPFELQDVDTNIVESSVDEGDSLQLHIPRAVSPTGGLPHITIPEEVVVTSPMETPSASEGESSPLVVTMAPPLGLPPPEEFQADVEAAIANTPSILRRSTRVTKGVPPARYTASTSMCALLTHMPSTLLYSFAAAMHSSGNHEVPNTHKEAMARPDAKEWQAAESTELAQLKKLQVARLVTLPVGSRLLPSRWVYSRKRTSGLYKARFVARGDKQRPGEDFQETFASVVRSETLHTILALVTTHNLHAKAFDVVTAFLNALMEGQAPMYVRPPPGYEEYDEAGQLLVWLLSKALYGLRQSPRLWYLEITKFMAAHGFSPIPADPCVLINTNGDILVLWVDGIIAIASTTQAINRMQAILQSKYELREMGDLTEYLGLLIVRDRERGTLHISQRPYGEKLLTRFHMEDTVALPAPSTGADRLLPNPSEASAD